MTLSLAAAAHGQDARQWQLEPAGESVESPLTLILPEAPIGPGGQFRLSERPRLTVAVSPGLQMQRTEPLPAFSLSLEAWEMNTASLAHIQCSRATRTIESFLVEDCRFVEQPLPNDSASLVQVQGRWMATPGLSIGAGAYTGRQSTLAGAGPVVETGGSGNGGMLIDQVQGVNMNVSFGLSMGQIGNLLLDLQLERYRRSPESFSLNRGMVPPMFGGQAGDIGQATSYSSAGQLGVAWRGSQFGADLTGQYQELPYWMGERLHGEGFRSFDLEFSWRAPARSSISLGISNLLNHLPGAAAKTSDQGMEETLDGIYGRIPYVRYKHDL